MRFSVITVCLNAESVIAKTIESVLNQTYSPYEYLIFDGNSLDGTVKIAESYRTQFEKKGSVLSFKVKRTAASSTR